MHMLTNEYRLLRRLGAGGMGEVWEAARIKANDVVVPCAIKLLHADFTETARERRLFFDEARIATQLDHSRIVKVIDVGTTRNGQPFLVMERVDGVDLRGFVRVANEESITHLEFDVVAYIVGEILAALDYAHARTVGGQDGGVIHSDVTPGNIMISSNGEVKLTDFGIARFAATAAPMSRAIGTPRYMAPEQLMGEPQRATDIYGLGVVLHELLEGKRFLDGVTPDQFHARVLSGPPPELERESVPAWLDELRRKMIATNPDDRPSASAARSVVLGNCGRYAMATERLRRDYASLIGRPRSGVTLLHVEASERRARAAEVESSKPAEVEDDGVAPTELLPPIDNGEPTPDSAVEPPPAQQTASPHLRWLALGSIFMSVIMGIIGFTLLFEFLREPEAEIVEEVARVVDEQPPQTEDPRPAVQPSEDPSGSIDGPEVSAIEQPESPDPPVADKPESKPTPKAKPMVGVMFLVESEVDGEIRAGRKIVKVTDRSGYAELTPGPHEIKWRPKGSTTWLSHGKVTLEAISPLRYKVRLEGGKIVEFEQI